jgi:transcriptional regulator with XRE-family HTH domain
MDIKIGTVLTGLLKDQGWSLNKLSKLSGVPASTLGEWSNNRPPRNPVQVRRVAVTLGVSMHYLYFGIEDSEEPLTKILKEDLFKGTFEITIKRVKF